jgi:hypothetical protein
VERVGSGEGALRAQAKRLSRHAALGRGLIAHAARTQHTWRQSVDKEAARGYVAGYNSGAAVDFKHRVKARAGRQGSPAWVVSLLKVLREVAPARHERKTILDTSVAGRKMGLERCRQVLQRAERQRRRSPARRSEGVGCVRKQGCYFVATPCKHEANPAHVQPSLGFRIQKAIQQRRQRLHAHANVKDDSRVVLGQVTVGVAQKGKRKHQVLVVAVFFFWGGREE